MKVQTDLMCPFCNGRAFAKIFSYHTPPKLEIKFQFNASEPYYREVHRCEGCGHFVSVHAMDMSVLYAGDYVDSTYGGEEGMKRAFQRIISLDPSKSDNAGRIKRILEFAADYLSESLPNTKSPSLLDIGSGLGVFVHGMKQAGWACTALDPDARSAHHIQNTIGVNAIRGDFLDFSSHQKFDVITFNKVLEHIDDPVQMLTKSARHLNPKGFVYVEVPDGEIASLDGPEREEFAIDHHHIFSVISLALLVNRAGFFAQRIERLQEPSTKYTLRAFLTLPRETV